MRMLRKQMMLSIWHALLTCLLWCPVPLSAEVACEAELASLIQHAARASANSTSIPKVIYMYWQQGWPSSTANVSLNLVRSSWEFFNPEFKLVQLNRTSADELTNRSAYIPQDIFSKLGAQHRADVYRSLLLYKYGGVWADASLFCNAPLTSWLDMNSKDLIAFRRDDGNFGSPKQKAGLYPMVSNWFLAAPPQSHMMSEMVKVISNPSEQWRLGSEYHWMHRIFAEMAGRDPYVFKRIEEDFPTADWPHGFRKDWRENALVLKRIANNYLMPFFPQFMACCDATGLRKITSAACMALNCSKPSVNIPYPLKKGARPQPSHVQVGSLRLQQVKG
ncbi:unnamed protein product [Symbiodinium pilosum]|uniref:Alpha 1,4-glycosyltransferase domain-containing protein n=1 Tax=Symbiodinium pilosum TaxID=2952 RepID=A0A812QTJ6_SYMPI|nr:unnamed protein product [Symbiodinium pilosum]